MTKYQGRGLHCMTIEGATIVTIGMTYLKTLHTTIYTSWRGAGRVMKSKGKSYYGAIKIPNGTARHHIAYHFDDPHKGVVVISKRLHNQVHSGIGTYGGEMMRNNRRDFS